MWQLVTSTFTLRGRRGTYGTGLAVAHPPSLCVAGVALTALCVACAALGDIHLWVISSCGLGTCELFIHGSSPRWPGAPYRRHREALRFAADSTCQCAVVLYHELILRAAADMDAALLEGVQDMQPVRAQLRDLFRAAQWLCRFTFRENDYQQTLELECRHLTPCLRASRAEAVVAPEALNRKVSHCQMNNGCPVAPLAIHCRWMPSLA